VRGAEVESYVKIEGSQTRNGSDSVPEKGKTRVEATLAAMPPADPATDPTGMAPQNGFRPGTFGKNQGTGPPCAGTGAFDLQRHQRRAAGKCRHPEILDEVFAKLRSAGNRNRGSGGGGSRQNPEAEEEDTSRLDALDDPVRMYLKQMGQVALLTREQEVEISKRIEAAENEIRKIIYSLGFAGKEHIALAEKLAGRPAPRTV
jgi:hypothetical protein